MQVRNEFYERYDEKIAWDSKQSTEPRDGPAFIMSIITPNDSTPRLGCMVDREYEPNFRGFVLTPVSAIQGFRPCDLKVVPVVLNMMRHLHGDFYDRPDGEADEITFDVEKIHIDPKFIESKNGLALLEIDVAASTLRLKYSQYYTDLKYWIEDTSETFGYRMMSLQARTESSGPKWIAVQLDSALVNRDYCNAIYAGEYELLDNEICVWLVESCDLLYGGLITTSYWDNVYGMYTRGLNVKSNCNDTTRPAVFTSIEYQQRWIDEIQESVYNDPKYESRRIEFEDEISYRHHVDSHRNHHHENKNQTNENAACVTEENFYSIFIVVAILNFHIFCT